MNPGEFREVGHRVVDLLAEYLEHIEEKPVFPNVEPSTLTEFFAEPLPQDSSPPEKVLARAGREASSVLHACRASRVHGPDHSLAQSHRNHRRFHLLRPQPKYRSLHDWPRCRRHGAAHRALAYRPGRLRREGGRQPHQRRHDGELHRPEAGARLRFRATAYSTTEYGIAGQCTPPKSGTFR